MLTGINNIISILFMILFSYQIVYIIVSLFIKEKEERYEFSYHRYGILICARNEENVIGSLLQSINRQKYPKDKYRVFVMADNCTDNTAAIARNHGTTVYERFNNVKVGKGYALEELLKHIDEDHPDECEAFMVFDADNILKDDYILQMNISYCKGNKIVAGYINTKNYDSNWISAGYSLFLLKKNRFLNNARHLLKTNCAINGTGFLFDKNVVKDWPYHTLTEDIEFSVDQACRNNRIAYCGRAVLYDEQPVSFSQSFNQRIRWAKGYLQVMKKYSLKLIRGMANGSFSCFDMLNTLVSAYSLSMITLLINVITALALIMSGKDMTSFLQSMITGLVKAYMCLYISGLLTTIAEWKNINSTSFNKIMYTFTFPVFIASYLPIAFCAMFKKVTWTPIRHGVSISSRKLRTYS
ncbi:MAG: glycosyltransferase family 2 protein [Erysipelotrichaceae bacterium]|nr:glycosyltransferase family 2 protein [Erysipelotrichaceae bacterium]